MNEVETGTQLIVVKQLPVIENQLRSVKSQVQQRVQEALSLVCPDEERHKFLKKVRMDLRSEFNEFEALRKQVKSQVLAPYEQFEEAYKECVADLYRYADAKLKEEIDSEMDEIKKKTEDEIRAYYKEYAESIGITDETIAPYESAGIKIGMNDSKKSLQKKAAEYLEKVKKDLEVIMDDPHRDEIMVEYRGRNDLSYALITVRKRYEAIEAEKRRNEELAQATAAITEAERKVAEVIAEVEEEEDEITIPTSAPDPEAEEKIYEVRFSIKAPLPKLKALKEFLINGGYEYATISDQ